MSLERQGAALTSPVARESIGSLDLDGHALRPADGTRENMKGGGGAPDGQLCASLLLAQLLSLALAVTGITSQALALRGVAVPTTQALLNYLLLAAVYGGARAARSGGLAQPAWRYALLALLDVEANFLVTKAYQYTSITSVTLLDCFTLPAVMALSRLMLSARYRAAHYAGAATCVAGLLLLVAGDAGDAAGGAAPLVGDALVLAGALCYALSNVAQERLLGEDVGAVELLGMLGVFGSLVAGVQVALFERQALAALALQPGTLLPLLGFVGALFLFYSLVPTVLVWGGATLLNLSLLSSDLWAALARVVLFGGFQGASAAYFGGSLVLVAGGTGLYAYACSARAPGGGSGPEYLRLVGREGVAGGDPGAGSCLEAEPSAEDPEHGAERGAPAV